MQKIDERSFKLQADEYFDYCKNRRIRGLWVITDKQSIFYSQVLKDDFRNHNNIEVDIENEIHPMDLCQVLGHFFLHILYFRI